MRVIFTVGAPGSGKTTWAKQQGIPVVCRDDIRAEIVGGIENYQHYKHTKENENKVTEIQYQQMVEYLTKRQNFIVGDTNLTDGPYKLLEAATKEVEPVEPLEVEIEQKLFDRSWVDLVETNKVRGVEVVPISVLRSMYKRFVEKYKGFEVYKPDTTKPKAVIFDIDGTLAIHHRKPFEYWKCLGDSLDLYVAELLRMYHSNGYKIIIMSGRNAGNSKDETKYKVLTEQWLAKYELPYDLLLMRNALDRRSDDIVKLELFNSIKDDFNVCLAVDDRDRVVELWRRLGIKCFQVDFGDF